MRYKNLGKSPLQVSTLCLGTMMFGDQTDLAEARNIVAHARENGVNFIDTADVYSTGGSETVVGECLRGDRANWILATKVGNKMSSMPNESHYSRTWMMRECDASLARLNTDYIDIYYMHRDFNGMDLEEPLRAIDALLRAGKIRYWGISNFRGWRIAEITRMAHELNIPGPSVCQPYYNLLNRMPEVEVLPACAHYGLGVVPYSPIARGVLTGKYAPGVEAPKESRVGRGDARIMQTEFREESLLIAQTLQSHCASKNISLSHFATAWVLANKSVSAVIAGPRTLAQWQDYFGALDLAITMEDEALVDSLVHPGHPSTPGYTDPVYPLSTGRPDARG
jgi:aryl-alcohol dehydrogenase-like predicted oxidoreductase